MSIRIFILFFFLSASTSLSAADEAAQATEPAEEAGAQFDARILDDPDFKQVIDACATKKEEEGASYNEASCYQEQFKLLPEDVQTKLSQKYIEAKAPAEASALRYPLPFLQPLLPYKGHMKELKPKPSPQNPASC